MSNAKPVSICVFIGSSLPKNPLFSEAVTKLGQEIALRQHTLVYGGSSRGMMGLLADAVLQSTPPSKVIGVLPESMKNHEFQHDNLTELHITDSMHSRKAKMEQVSDAFLVLPGGIGTMEEFFEIYTWLQLSIHSKPIGLINIDGYFDGILAWLKRSVSEGLVNQLMFDNLIVVDSVVEAVQQVEERIQLGADGVKGQYGIKWN
ncbi:hypothetical protein HDV02_000927 [Globomyces sp. JEL0801]|nr:hypothetical protein HDV02_000927 [Globomyces sp. JEL0801]